MLAALDDDEVERVLVANTKVLETQYAYYRAEQIREDVAITRSQGYALNPGRIIAGSWGLGAAIMFPDGRIAGALSIAAIDSRMGAERQPELVRLLRTEVERVEGKLRKMFLSAGAAL
jgi:DNA-binding IclR family transcriptional regulator